MSSSVLGATRRFCILKNNFAKVGRDYENETIQVLSDFKFEIKRTGGAMDKGWW